MIDWLVATLRHYPELAIFVALAVVGILRCLR